MQALEGAAELLDVQCSTYWGCRSEGASTGESCRAKSGGPLGDHRELRPGTKTAFNVPDSFNVKRSVGEGVSRDRRCVDAVTMRC
jgi:hypothetical protein